MFGILCYFFTLIQCFRLQDIFRVYTKKYELCEKKQIKVSTDLTKTSVFPEIGTEVFFGANEYLVSLFLNFKMCSIKQTQFAMDCTGCIYVIALPCTASSMVRDHTLLRRTI